jgi:hypothetical protein
MNDTAPTQPDDDAAAAWHRHYAAAAERRREAERHGGPRPYLHYAQREARWLVAFALIVAALLVAGATLYR